jgi:hypothetical protein
MNTIDAAAGNFTPTAVPHCSDDANPFVKSHLSTNTQKMQAQTHFSVILLRSSQARMRRSQQQHASRIFDCHRASRAAQLAHVDDGQSARHALARSSRRSRRTSRSKFYSNRRRATLSSNSALFDFFANASCLFLHAWQRRRGVDRSRAVDIVRSLLARISVRFPFARKRLALCLPGRVYSDERVTLVQSCEKAILHLIRHAKSR